MSKITPLISAVQKIQAINMTFALHDNYQNDVCALCIEVYCKMSDQWYGYFTQV